MRRLLALLLIAGLASAQTTVINGWGGSSSGIPAGAGVVYNGAQNPAGGAFTPSVVQSRAVINATSGAFASNVTSGNLLVAVIGDETANVGSATVSDTRGSTWTPIITVSGSTTIRAFYSMAASSGADTVTFAYTSAGWASVTLLEVSNASAVLDGTAVGQTNSGAPGTLTTTASNSLVVSAMQGFSSSIVWTPPSGWTETQGNGHDGAGIAWTLQASPGSVTPNFSANSPSGESIVLFAFKAKVASPVSAGSNGDYYFRTDASQLFGPKASGTWPSSPVAYTQTIASGSVALGTTAIASASCATVVTASATGTATTDVLSYSFNADPTGITGFAPSSSGMLTILAYPTANTANFKVCNNTAASITPGAVTLNWRVAR